MDGVLPPLSKITAELSIETYARQFGALCALWYLVGGTDLHSENILFTKKGVVIIDCETVFDADFDYYFLENSSILPRLEPYAVRHSILGTQALVVFMSNLNAQEEKIHQAGGIAHFQALFKSAVQSRKKLSQHDWFLQPVTAQGVNWIAFTEDVCKSMQATLRYFSWRPSQELFSVVKAHFAGRTQSRMLLRATNSYGALLYNVSLQFKALHRREGVIRYLTRQLGKIPSSHNSSMDQNVVELSEVAQLARLDIPYFFREIGQNRIHSSPGFEHIYKDLDFSSLKHRLTWLREPSFIEGEIYLARLALAPWPLLEDYELVESEVHDYKKKYYREGGSFYASLPSDGEPAILHSTARIARQLQNELRHANEVEHAFYLAATGRHDDIYQLLPTSYSLLAGWAGKLLFLGCYGVVTNQTKVIQLVNQELKYFIQLGSNQKYLLEHQRGGIAGGYQSLIYSFECLKRLGVLDEYPDEILKTMFQHRPDLPDNYELLRGDSGNVLLAIMLREHLAPELLMEWKGHLKRSMQGLLTEWDDKRDKQRVGLAHGAMGPCLAASRLYQIHQDDELRSLTLSLASVEANLGQKNVLEDSLRNGWCFGGAGRALAYFNMGRAFDLPEFVKEAQRLVNLKQGLQFPNHTLCCGSLSLVAAHLAVHKDEPKYQDRGYRLEVLNEFYKNPHDLLVKVERKTKATMPTDLFYGLSGLGMVLLYCLDPTIVPAVWIFE